MEIKKKSGKVYQYKKRVLNITKEDLEHIKSIKNNLKSITNKIVTTDDVLQHIISYYNNSIDIKLEKNDSDKFITINTNTYLKIKKIQEVLLEKCDYEHHIALPIIISLLINNYNMNSNNETLCF